MTLRLAIASALTTATLCPAQVRINEVLVDPVGPNSGFQLVELTNERSRSIDFAGWHLAASGMFLPLPAITLRGDRTLRIHVGATGTTTPADIYLPNLADLPSSGSITLVRGDDPNDPALIEDFVSWNGGSQNIVTAITAGQWPSTLESVTLPAGEGISIAHLGDAAFNGSSEPSAWIADRTPTLGLPNDVGSAFNLGMGCPTANPAPWAGLARDESRPWIGEVFELDLYNLPQPVGMAGLFLGSFATPPHPLDSLGLPGCASLIALEYGTSLATLNGFARFRMAIPDRVELVGCSFYAQAIVPFPGAPNAAGALVTNAVIATVGSR